MQGQAIVQVEPIVGETFSIPSPMGVLCGRITSVTDIGGGEWAIEVNFISPIRKLEYP